MAQAARLNLRMQKELKLLLSDPPPGASFPLLSADADRSSSSFLSTIHAQIEGPEGTVYANGVFKITIQIPERYPFQPPSVTFATPIYHPNIDNGGRICLDILNLPPKGAWQPSLNISTVLTSIGLLLSEPNPDDGLMCEASREYKYNIQAFDQKARSMTDKYAKAGAYGSCDGCQVTQSSLSPSKVEAGGSAKESKHEANEYILSHKKQCGINPKLSLESSGSTQKRGVNNRVIEMPNEFVNQLEVKGPNEGTRQKLSLKFSSYSKMSNGGVENKVVQNHCLSHLDPLSLSLVPSELLVVQADDCCRQPAHQDKNVNACMNTSSKRPYKLSLESSDKCQTGVGNDDNISVSSPQLSDLSSLSHLKVSHRAMPTAQVVEHSGSQPPKDGIDRMMNDSIKTDCKKLCSVGKKLSLGSLCSSWILENSNTQNVVPIQNLQPSHTLPSTPCMPSLLSDACKPSGGRGVNFCENESAKLYRIGQKVLLESLSQPRGSTNDKSQLLQQSQNLCQAQSKPLKLSPDSKCHEQQQQQPGEAPDGETAGVNKLPVTESTEESLIPDAIIVLDSEDSEEESNASSRFKLLVARRRMARKLKAQV